MIFNFFHLFMYTFNDTTHFSHEDLDDVCRHWAFIFNTLVDKGGAKYYKPYNH